MKKLLTLFLGLLALTAHAGTTTIEAIPTTIVLPASNDYIPVGGATRGTNKLLLAALNFVTATRTTLAALSITGAADGTGILVLGNTAAGDGGGASYYWSASSTATPNGNTVIQPASLPSTGRWLKAVGGIGLPSVSNVGGVFSNVGASHQWVHSINTDGSVTLTQPTAGDITGLGTMALEASNAVSITGGNIDLTVLGATNPAAGTFTTLKGTLGVTSGDGAAATSAAFFASGGTNSGAGGLIAFQRGFSGKAFVGTDSAVRSTNSDDLALQVAASGGNINLYASTTLIGQFSATGLNGTPIGQTIAAAASVTSLAVSGDATIQGNQFFGTNANEVRNAAVGQLFYYAGATWSGTQWIARTTAPAGMLVSGTGFTMYHNPGSTIGNPLLPINAVAQFNATSSNIISPLTVSTIQPSSNANSRTSKTSFNVTVINVKDFGATGNGSTDDAAAIQAAAAAITNNSTLYFPPGRYRITSGFAIPNSTSNVKVTGDSAEIYNDSGSAGGNTLYVDNTSVSVEVCNLRFTGSSTVRGNGIHIRMAASNNFIHNCYFQGCSDFAVLESYGAGGWLSNFVVSDNEFYEPLGDGIHVASATDGTITGNTLVRTGDDAIALVADTVGNPPNRITVVGNTISYAGGAPSSVSGRGIVVYEAIDVLVEANAIYAPYQSAIEVGRFQSTTTYNARVGIVGNKIYNSANGTSGPRGAIWMRWCNQSNVIANQVIDTVNGSAISFLDCNDLTIKNNFIRKSPSRAIAADDPTTTNVGTSWTQIYITGNDIDWVLANEAIYVVPGSGITLTGLVITNNNGQVLPGGNWIFYDRITTGRVYNNTNTNGATVAAGGTVTGVTFGNNN